MQLNNLQILRGISALLVCCFHFREDLNFSKLNLGELLFSQGGVGVPVFFVISGFIMTFTTQKLNFEDGKTFKKIITFYKRRIIRIVPLYYLLTFLWILIGGNILLYFKGELFSRLIHSLLFLPQREMFPVLFLGWSLNFEMFFYLIFGFSVLFKSKRYFLIILFFVTAYISGLLFESDRAVIQMATSILNLYFVTGIIFALILKNKIIPAKIAKFAAWAGIVLFTFMFLQIFPFKNQFLSLAVISLFVFSFLLFDFSLHLKANRFLVFVGNISYSLYLSHPFADIIFKKIKINNDILRLPYFLLKMIFVIILASFFYYFVEKKITNYLKRKLNA